MSDTSSLLDTYLPFLPEGAWEEMRESVLDRVRPYALEHSEASARQTLAVLTGYIHWAREQGLIARPDDPRAEGLIDLHLQHRTTRVRPHWAAREAAILRELFGAQKIQRRTIAPPRVSDAPYTDAEVARIRAWAGYAPSTRKRLDRTAIAALALGGGLTASEMMTARTDDLLALDDGDLDVVVRGPPARTVPVLPAWAPLLAGLRTGTDGADWLIAPGRTNRGGQTLNCLRREPGGGTRPVPRRMRNTWLVTKLNGGTAASEVMTAAGLRNTDFLRRLAPFIHTPSSEEQRTLLRDGGTHA